MSEIHPAQKIIIDQLKCNAFRATAFCLCGLPNDIMPPKGAPNASERGKESEVAQKGAGWLRNPCRLGESLTP